MSAFRKVQARQRSVLRIEELQLRPASITDSPQQGIRIIQKETAGIISREVSKFFDHVDRAYPRLSRYEGRRPMTATGRVSVEAPESPCKALVIQGEALHGMPALNHTGCAAADKSFPARRRRK